MNEIMSKEEIRRKFDYEVYTPYMTNQRKLEIFEEIWEAAQQKQPAGLRWITESLEFANKLKKAFEGAGNWNGQSDCERLIELLESLSSALPLQKVDWMDVEVGLPETNKGVKVTADYLEKGKPSTVKTHENMWEQIEKEHHVIINQPSGRQLFNILKSKFLITIK